MAKSKKRKRRPQRPNRPNRPAHHSGGGGGGGVDAAVRPERAERDAQQGPSRREERREEARHERERRIKQNRRRQQRRRAIRWLVALAVVAGIALLILRTVNESKKEAARFDMLAETIGSIEGVQEPVDEGEQHIAPADPDPTYDTVPAASGPHDSSPLSQDPAVYTQPVPERAAVHNLEHGYVLIYYRADGADALPQPIVDELAGIAEGQAEVIMAPYPELEEGTNLALVAWTRLLTAGVPAETDPGDVREVAEGFIDRFKNETAPEADIP